MSSATTAHEALEEVHEQFEDLEKQAHAARLGLWIFIASEALMFSALFVLYGAMRFEHAAAFREALGHATKVLGSINTAILLVSSGFSSYAASAMRAGKRGSAAASVVVTILLGLAFLAIKIIEYVIHGSEGIGPGGHGHFFLEHADRGLPPFWTLYFTMTGLHAVHLVVGVLVMAFALYGILRGHIDQRTAYRLECCAMYWSFIDFIWIFLWPLFYLA